MENLDGAQFFLLNPITLLSSSSVSGHLVPRAGLEPAKEYSHMNLNHTRLPIPPSRLSVVILPDPSDFVKC